ncbi:MAG: metallophosphoesterase [Bacteroidales bacterium]
MKNKCCFLTACLLVLWPVCAKALDDIKIGPWVTNVSETSVTIIWISNSPGMGYVELEDGERLYDMYAGRRNIDNLHTVSIKNLAKGSTLRYRVGGELLSTFDDPYYPVFGESYCGEWYNVNTFDTSSAGCHFSVINDIHLHTDEYTALTRQIDSNDTGFIFLNGDIISANHYDIDKLARFEIEPLAEYAHCMPVMFARGNHEGRGNGIRNVAKIFPNDVSEGFYYTFREGPVAFIVFDGGETNTNRSKHYSGTEVYEQYMLEQIEWARQAMDDSLFKSAPVKVCFAHVPMIDLPDQTEDHLQRWMHKHIVPILNHAGIDLMIGADLHEYMYFERGTMQNDFPIFVNDDRERLDCFCKDGMIIIKTYNAKGEMIHMADIPYDIKVSSSL